MLRSDDVKNISTVAKRGTRAKFCKYSFTKILLSLSSRLAAFVGSRSSAKTSRMDTSTGASRDVLKRDEMAAGLTDFNKAHRSDALRFLSHARLKSNIVNGDVWLDVLFETGRRSGGDVDEIVGGLEEAMADES